jgi:hypothetical protein
VVAAERRGNDDRKPNTLAPLFLASRPHLGWVEFCPGQFSSLPASLWKRQMWKCASPPHQSEQSKAQQLGQFIGMSPPLLNLLPLHAPYNSCPFPLLLHHTFPFHHFCTEMEFFLVEVPEQKLESSQTQVFVWFSTLFYPFYKMLLMNRLEFF